MNVMPRMIASAVDGTAIEEKKFQYGETGTLNAPSLAAAKKL